MIWPLRRWIKKRVPVLDRLPAFPLAHRAAVAALLCAVLPACIPAAIPDTSPASVATIVAGTFAAAATASPMTAATLNSTRAPTPRPPTPVPSPAPATRVNFAPDGTTATITVRVQPNQLQSFVLHADLGQPLLVQLDSGVGDLALSIRSQGGTMLLSADEKQVTWRGSLPQTENYYIDIHGGSTAEDMQLTVQLARKIIFKEGAAAARVLDKTAGGSVMVYSVLGVKGDTMDVGLSGVGTDASLAVSGYVDGETYLTAEKDKTSFSMELPSTQDYIIEVVPKDSKVLNFALGVQME